MSSEFLASGQNVLDSNLGGAWDITNGYAGRKQDLGIARRFGGASGAYSLRDIGAMNGSVVRVRRSPHDTTDAINDEQKFSANQVSSRALEDWVNGKLENVLPADIATAAAAYSLRKVKASYSGNAVRIRRSSDDIEVNVAFDSDDKVSASSPITDGGTELTPDPDADLGSTTATTLGDFLGQTSITTGVAQMASGDSSALSNATTTGFTLTQTGSLIGAMFPFSSNISAGTKVTMTFTLSEDVGNATSTFRLFGTSDLLNAGNPSTIAKNDAGTYTIEFEATSEARGIGFYDNISGSVVTISNASITIENSAFVHTWYDQAGSNNAVQDTADKQPQIASSGALLDGIKFNADVSGSSPDFLETGSKLGDTTDFFIATVIGEAQGQDAFGGIITSRSASDEGFAFGLNGSERAQAFIYATAGNTNDISDEVVGTPKRLLSLDKDSTTVNGNVNASPAFSFTSNTMGSITTDKSIIGYGGRTDSISDTLGLRANINELIFYETDQADNRFLIESEINNYYNIYNDEYEWDDASNTEWQNSVTDGSTTFVANGKDGFTITATGENITGFKYRFTSPSSASNNYYRVSFNVDDPDGLFEDAQLRLTATGSGATAQTITNGFNSLSLRTGSSFEFMTINSDGGGSEKTATLSDFRISRIARNGFVETWYDQSDSGNNATQGTAANQPSIVQNGGLCTSNGSPSVFFTGDTRDDQLDFTDLTLTDATIFTVVNIDSSADQQIILGGSTSTATGTMIPMMDNGSSTTQVYKNSTVGGAEQGSSQFKNGAQITLADRDDAFDNLAVDSQILFTMVDVDVAEAKVLDGISRCPADAFSFHLQGQMNELIIYNSNLSSDRGTIESEIANHYNITLS